MIEELRCPLEIARFVRLISFFKENVLSVVSLKFACLKLCKKAPVHGKQRLSLTTCHNLLVDDGI